MIKSLNLGTTLLLRFGIGIVALLVVATCADAQTTITSLEPASCQPGVPTKLTLKGTKLPSDLRVLTNRTDVKVEVESVTDVHGKRPMGPAPKPRRWRQRRFLQRSCVLSFKDQWRR